MPGTDDTGVRAATMLWRRIDAPGHDACRLEPNGSGWRLSGCAVFLHEGRPAQVRYRVDCDESWRSTSGTAEGWVGDATISAAVVRHSDGRWELNGVGVPGLEHCLDLDYGFTPATNLFQLRRLGLDLGEGGDAPVAWLDVGEMNLSLLEQHYERRSSDTYWYTAPRFSYQALLQINSDGFATRYPGQWEAARA